MTTAVQVESGAVNVTQDAQHFWRKMMHTLPTFLEPAEPNRTAGTSASTRVDHPNQGGNVSTAQGAEQTRVAEEVR